MRTLQQGNGLYMYLHHAVSDQWSVPANFNLSVVLMARAQKEMT